MSERPKLMMLVSFWGLALLLNTGLAQAELVDLGTNTAEFGDSSSYFTSTRAVYTLNTDDGKMRRIEGGATYEHSAALGRVVTQDNGAEVMVFDFDSFSFPAGMYLSVYGSRPAAVMAKSDITISGGVTAWAGGGAGGGGCDSGGAAGGDGSPAATGGEGGQTTNTFGTAAGTGGGGGGYGPGLPGSALLTGEGGGTFNPAFLQGGGGGGGGGAYDNGDPAGDHIAGYDGDRGGGGLIFDTPGDFHLATDGWIHANGDDAEDNPRSMGGPGGGGGGGMLVFQVDGDWIGHGNIRARGGEGGTGQHHTGGDGGGGYVYIDPVNITLNGLIDVSNGSNDPSGMVVMDYTGTFTNNGQIVGSVPEPATMSLFVPGGLALLRRRRRAA